MVITARYPASLVLAICVCLSGCVPLGKPVVSERSNNPPYQAQLSLCARVTLSIPSLGVRAKTIKLWLKLTALVRPLLFTQASDYA